MVWVVWVESAQTDGLLEGQLGPADKVRLVDKLISDAAVLRWLNL